MLTDVFTSGLEIIGLVFGFYGFSSHKVNFMLTGKNPHTYVSTLFLFKFFLGKTKYRIKELIDYFIIIRMRLRVE